MRILITFWLAVILGATASAEIPVGGEVVGRNIFGLATDYQGDPLIVDDRPLIYSKSNVNSDLAFEGSDFFVSAFGHAIGSIYVSYKDGSSGSLLDTGPLDISGIGGISYPKGYVKTQWDSLLIGSSAKVNTAEPKEFVKSYRAYFKNKDNLINAYNYGYPLEVIMLDDQGQAKLIKHYAVGRVLASDMVLMPDGKTLYLMDAENSGHLYVFIAAEPNSFSKGTLYVVDNGSGKMKLVELGSSSALKMKFKLKKIAFDQVFNAEKPDNNNCSEGFDLIKTIYGSECLKVSRKYKKEAGLFEPIRVAALKNVKSVGFSTLKFNADNNSLILSGGGQSNRTLSLATNSNLQSDFIIQE